MEEAHKRGLKIYIWFETYYAGPENPMKNPMNVISVYPKWANTTKMKYNSPAPVASLSEHNGYFLDPANRGSNISFDIIGRNNNQIQT